MKTWHIAAIGLLALHLAAFSNIWFMNAHATDDWNHLGATQRALETNNWFFPVQGRQGGTFSIIVSQVMMPGRFQGMYYFHLAVLYGVMVGLFYLARHFFSDWFSFLIAAIFATYIPYNNNYVASFLSLNAWVLLLCVVSVALLMDNPGWLKVIVSGILAYWAVRGYENAMVLLAPVPLLMFYPIRTQYPIMKTLLWWCMVGVGALQFLIPYLRGDASASYQTSQKEAGLHIPTLIHDTGWFYQNAFPIKTILHTPFENLVPAILMVSIFLVTTLLMWRQEPIIIPGWRTLLASIGVGMFLIACGGAAFIYAGEGFVELARSQLFAAPGQAVVIAGSMGLLALGIQELVRIKMLYGLVGLAVIFFFTAGQWFAIAQSTWNKSISFDEKTIALRQLVALLPNVQNDTLIAFTDCQEKYGGWYIPSIAATYQPNSVRYLYGHVRRTGIQGAYLEGLGFTAAGVNFPAFSSFDPIPAREYRYDQIIVVACDDDRLRILDHFPAEYTPAGAALETYNPYARITGGFIPPERSLILGK